MSKQPTSALEKLTEALTELTDIAQAIMHAQHSFFLFMVMAVFMVLTIPKVIQLYRSYQLFQQYKQELGTEVWKARSKLKWYIPHGTVVVQDYRRQPSLSLVFLKVDEEAPDPTRLIKTQEHYNEYLKFQQTIQDFDGTVVSLILIVILFLYMLFVK